MYFLPLKDPDAYTSLICSLSRKSTHASPLHGPLETSSREPANLTEGGDHFCFNRKSKTRARKSLPAVPLQQLCRAGAFFQAVTSGGFVSGTGVAVFETWRDPCLAQKRCFVASQPCQIPPIAEEMPTLQKWEGYRT